MARQSSRRTGRTEEAAPRTSYRGAAGLKRMEQELARKEAEREMRKNTPREPFRFFCTSGEEREIIIVDDEPDFFRNEHQLKDRTTGRYSKFVPCIDEAANCPVCAAPEAKQPYFAMYLTVIDLTPYTNRDGEEIEWSKKLLVVKASQQKKFSRLFAKHGTLRGLNLLMTRTGDKSAAIGDDIEDLGFYEEDELEEFVTEYTDREGNVQEIIGHEPYDYEEIFPDMTERQLAAIAGVDSGTVGNRRNDDESIGRSRPGRSRNRAEEDEEEPAPRRSSRRASRDEEEEEEAPRRARGRRAAQEDEEEEAPAPRRSSRRAAAVEEEEDEPAPRRGRGRAEEEEEEAEDEPAPRRTASTSAASRRAAIRGARR